MSLDKDSHGAKLNLTDDMQLERKLKIPNKEIEMHAMPETELQGLHPRDNAAIVNGHVAALEEASYRKDVNEIYDARAPV